MREVPAARQRGRGFAPIDGSFPATNQRFVAIIPYFAGKEEVKNKISNIYRL